MDTTGGGEAQSELVNKATSRGFIRKQGLVVYSNNGNAAEAVYHDQTVAEDTSIIPATASVVTETSSAASQQSVTESRIKQARMQGYEGESCPECQNFTLVRNGTCLKCNTCGSTTGCS